MSVIGGYALRAFVDYSRATRDCDFVAQKQNGRNLDSINDWRPEGFHVETMEKHDSFGFLRWVSDLSNGKSVRVSVDFLEGEVGGKTDKQIMLIDDDFVNGSQRVKIAVAGKEFEMFVPTYADYLILKIVSSRPSDVRDIATLLWKKGVPKGIKRRAKQIVPHREVLDDNVRSVIVREVSNKRFLNSWHGMFATSDFDESARGSVLRKLEELL